MKVYADTNFFTNVWAELRESDQAAGLLRTLKSSQSQLPITWLLRMEFTNALQRLVFETRQGGQFISVSQEAALVARGMFDELLAEGDGLVWVQFPAEEFEALFESLVYRHTAKEGFRTYDIMHVASALLLGCDTFWSFDRKACRLAQLEGLKTN